MGDIKLKADCELERALNAYASAVEPWDNWREARAHLLEVIRGRIDAAVLRELIEALKSSR